MVCLADIEIFKISWVTNQLIQWLVSIVYRNLLLTVIVIYFELLNGFAKARESVIDINALADFLIPREILQEIAATIMIL